MSDHIPPEYLGWIQHVLNRLETVGPTDATHSFVQLGVDDPVNCHCEDMFGSLDFEDDPHLWWLHCHHRQFNRAVWEALPTHHRLAIRRVIRRDLLVPDTITDIEEEYGHLVRKDYGRKLLDHFLIARPEWC